MSEIQIFKNPEFGTVRTIEENGKIIFCGTDIASSLGYTNPQKAIKDHCREDGVTFRSVIDNIGRTQQAKFIDEGNLYRLITHSKLPAADRFEGWVFDEVLPTIRKHGHILRHKRWKKL
ncbi:Bro-N domain-containing protein [Clostridium ljungdahlii]|uniref:BRO-N domain-containing protein n=1 Tax=Clostridium ljungdahlii TaxID=1538 RepID=UPI00386F8B76